MLDDADICIGCYVWKLGQKPCKHHVNVSTQVWNLALLAAPTEQLDAARHFETADHKQYDKAVILYEKVCRKILLNLGVLPAESYLLSMFYPGGLPREDS